MKCFFRSRLGPLVHLYSASRLVGSKVVSDGWLISAMCSPVLQQAGLGALTGQRRGSERASGSLPEAKIQKWHVTVPAPFCASKQSRKTIFTGSRNGHYSMKGEERCMTRLQVGETNEILPQAQLLSHYHLTTFREGQGRYCPHRSTVEEL